MLIREKKAYRHKLKSAHKPLVGKNNMVKGSRKDAQKPREKWYMSVRRKGQHVEFCQSLCRLDSAKGVSMGVRGIKWMGMGM